MYDRLLELLDGHEYQGYFAALCPFHNDSKPSLFVYPDGFRCAACGKKGSLKFLSQKIGSHFSPSRNTVSSNILPHWRKWGDTAEEIAEQAHKTLLHFPQFQGYLKKRRYEKFIEQGYFGYNSGWLVVPVFDAGRKIVDILVRAIKGKGETRYVVRPGKSERPLYSPNWERVQNSTYTYVVFGIFDAWAMEAIGEPCVTGITGKSVPPALLEALGKRGIIIPDQDEAPDAHRLANRLGWRYRVKELRFPEGTKDPSGIHELYGDEMLREILYT